MDYIHCRNALFSNRFFEKYYYIINKLTTVCDTPGIVVANIIIFHRIKMFISSQTDSL